MNLHDCQQEIINMIEPGFDGKDSNAFQLIQNTANLQPEKRIEIYRRSITSGQQKTLQLVFPVCQAILGEACFNTLARDYAWDKRSDCNDLNHYGHCFAEFLDEITNTHQAFTDYVYLGDLCRLEWVWHHCHFSEDTPAHLRLDFARMKTKNPESIRLGTIPALQMFASQWPVYEIWLKHQIEENTETEMPDSLQKLVVWRHNNLVIINELCAPFNLLLTKIEKGCTISQLADETTMNFQQLHKHLVFMADKGWIISQPNTDKHVQ